MDAVEKLMAEHRRIEAVLDCLNAAVDAARERGHIEADTFVNSIEFFRGYADRSHHHKEEQLLFPALERHGIPRESGPIGVMLDEHERGRELLRRMEEHLATRGANWIEELCRASCDYVDLLRQHIHKEDHVLFPMAADAFSDQDMKEMSRLFDEFDSAEDNRDASNQQILIAQQLCSRWGIEVRA